MREALARIEPALFDEDDQLGVRGGEGAAVSHVGCTFSRTQAVNFLIKVFILRVRLVLRVRLIRWVLIDDDVRSELGNSLARGIRALVDTDVPDRSPGSSSSSSSHVLGLFEGPMGTLDLRARTL